MNTPRFLGFAVAATIILTVAVPASFGQPPAQYYPRGMNQGGASPGATMPTNPYAAAPANPYAGAPSGAYGSAPAMGTYPGGVYPGSTAGVYPGAPAARGPIVARPFTAEPPKPLIGERLREEQADPLRVAIEEFTDETIENVDTIPVVNSLEEYRAVREAKEPAILFDGEVYIYVKSEDVYKPLNWDVQETNEAVWANLQFERAMRIAVFQQQRLQADRFATPLYAKGAYRPGAYQTPGGGFGTGYTGQPGVGAPGMPSGGFRR